MFFKHNDRDPFEFIWFFMRNILPCCRLLDSVGLSFTYHVWMFLKQVFFLFKQFLKKRFWTSLIVLKVLDVFQNSLLEKDPKLVYMGSERNKGPPAYGLIGFGDLQTAYELICLLAIIHRVRSPTLYLPTL